MVERKAGLSVMQDRNYLTAENESHRMLKNAGLHPQGRTQDFKQVVVFDFVEGDNNGKKEVYYFQNWQEAAEALIR